MEQLRVFEKQAKEYGAHLVDVELGLTKLEIVCVKMQTQLDAIAKYRKELDDVIIYGSHACSIFQKRFSCGLSYQEF